MADRVLRELDSIRKLSLNMGGCLILAALAWFGLIDTAQSQCQSLTADSSQGITGTWQGTLHVGRDLRNVVKISKADDGYKAVFYFIDQSGGEGFTASKVTLDGPILKMTLPGATYEGKLSLDGKNVTGDWTQGSSSRPMIFTRATPETEWTIPPPAPKLPQMAANANPSFEVATIKPSLPNRPGKNAGFSGGYYRSRNTNVNDLIALAYGLHAKQIVGAPDWFGTDLYDIEGKPDAEGLPNVEQIKTMLQKLLAERFKLTFHHDKRELSVYVISVAGGGPKITKSTSDPNALPTFGFRGLGKLIVTNMTMTDVATWMQAGVMDRPVVDQTELSGRYDFQLNWTPDESQFAQFRGTGRVVPPPTNDPNAPPSLYTAMQEQLGLKMGTAKFPDDVIVIDHVEKPSEN
jgi:bla regulator protein blaR1